MSHESLFQVSLASSLTVEALARELYPDAFYAGREFAEDYRSMQHLTRCLLRVGSKPGVSWQTQAAHDKQCQALKLAVHSLNERLSRMFYTWACWPDRELAESNPAGHIWYLLSAKLNLKSTSKYYQKREVKQYGRLTPKFWLGLGFSAENTLAIKVSNDDEMVHVGINGEWGLSSYYSKFTHEYKGPASGLMDWLRSHGVLAQRLDLVSNDTHHWQIP